MGQRYRAYCYLIHFLLLTNVTELQRQANPDIIIGLAGNKIDLAESNNSLRAISTEEGRSYAEETGLLFFETSAKEGTGVSDLFQEIGKKIPLDQLASRQRGTGRAGGVGGERIDILREGQSGAAGAQGQQNCAC
jgi:50S ribosomal subunit-associated GTPase HflX